MKKEMEIRGERRQNFKNFQISWNDCNSDGEVKEEVETLKWHLWPLDMMR